MSFSMTYSWQNSKGMELAEEVVRNLRAASPKYQRDLEIAKKSNFSKLAQNEALRALVATILSCLESFVKYFTSNQIAIYLALNVPGRKTKYDVQSVCYEEFCGWVYLPLNTPLIFDRFWPIWGIETKKLGKKIIFDLSSLKQYFCN